MNTVPRRSFKIGKLGFISTLVRESLLLPVSGRQHQPLPALGDETAITWIGHSSFLVEMAGKRILIDPVFSRFVVVLKRRRRPGVRMRDLPPIDLLLLTHAHMDHLDLPSLRRVLQHNRRLGAAAPVVVVPPGVQDLVERLGFREVRVLPTWDETILDGLTVTSTPARHWGRALL